MPKKQQRLIKQTKQQNGPLKRNGVSNAATEKSWRGADNAIIGSSCGVSNKGYFLIIEDLSYLLNI